MFANFIMNSNATFVMTYFLKLCYNVFTLENKIDALVFRKICVKMCYITLEIVLVCVNMERVSF
jgi:citrate lyase synthetase